MFTADDVAKAAVERGTIPVTQQLAIIDAIRDRYGRVFAVGNFGPGDLTQREEDALLFQWWQMRRFYEPVHATREEAEANA